MMTLQEFKKSFGTASKAFDNLGDLFDLSEQLQQKIEESGHHVDCVVGMILRALGFQDGTLAMENAFDYFYNTALADVADAPDDYPDRIYGRLLDLLNEEESPCAECRVE